MFVPLGNEGAGGQECRVRLLDGSLDEAIISVAEAQALLATSSLPQTLTQPVDAKRLRLLIESTRICLAYADDRQFAVSLSGMRTLPHQLEAVYQQMLPQPRPPARHFRAGSSATRNGHCASVNSVGRQGAMLIALSSYRSF